MQQYLMYSDQIFGTSQFQNWANHVLENSKNGKKKMAKSLFSKKNQSKFRNFSESQTIPAKIRNSTGGKPCEIKKNAKFKKHIKQKKTDLCSPLLLPTSPLNESIHRGGCIFAKMHGHSKILSCHRQEKGLTTRPTDDQLSNGWRDQRENDTTILMTLCPSMRFKVQRKSKCWQAPSVYGKVGKKHHKKNKNWMARKPVI